MTEPMAYNRLDRFLDRLGVGSKKRVTDEGAQHEPERTQTAETKMTRDRVEKGLALLKKYMGDKAAQDQRQIENERWWQLRSWDVTGSPKNPNDPKPNSAYTVNVILNKHADATDNYIVPRARPREQTDAETAEKLSAVLPVILQRNGYRKTYSTLWWKKLKYGTGITGVFWDTHKDNGIGDISIRCVDALNLAWEPGITNIQDSANVFYVELTDIDSIKAKYPDKAEKIEASRTGEPKKYNTGINTEKDNKCVLVDWYYKVYDGTKTLLHLCKLAGEVVLYCSEDDPIYAQRGFYDHGLYPFVFDVMLPQEDTPCGTGCIDLCKPAQEFIDFIDADIQKYCAIGARPRWFKRQDCKVNLDQYTDLSQDFVEWYGSGEPNETLKQIEINPLAGIYADIRNLKVEELKEISGNRDFNQGSTVSGVTAASAITALQEAGNKLARDYLSSSKDALEDVTLIVIELIRQFYTEERVFRITNKNNQQEFVSFGSANIAPRQHMVGGELKEYKPFFDIEIVTEKASPFSTVAQNERAIQMYQMGMFDPARADQAVAAVTLMDFDGKDETIERIRKGRTMYDVLKGVQQLVPAIMQMAAEQDMQKGTDVTDRIGSALQSFGFQVPLPEQVDYRTQGIQQVNAQNGAQKPTSPSDTPKSATTASDARFKTARAVTDV